MDPEALFGWTLFVLFVVVPVILVVAWVLSLPAGYVWQGSEFAAPYLLGLGLMFLAGLTGFGSDAR